jgi:hypothetical protein
MRARIKQRSPDRPITLRGISSSSRGGSMPGTIGTLPVRKPRCARYIESGVLDVRETPASTRSAWNRVCRFAPSSWRTANSTASMRLK